MGFFFYFQKPPVFIAVAGPLDNMRGKEMLKGIQLYIDKTNREGGINGRQVELLLYDDKDSVEIAEQIANRIADENKALMVLGHYWGYPSLAAGKIYKRNEIPAITASATIDAVTAGNEWYFRTIPGDDLQGSFIANYIHRTLKKQTVCILYSKDIAGSSLVEKFEKTASDIGLDIYNNWKLDFEDQDVDIKIYEIIDVIKMMTKPDILFLSMNAKNGARLIVALKDAGIDIPIFGTYSLGRGLIFELEQYPKEKKTPGYYSNGIYFTSQYIKEIGSSESFLVAREFYDVYGEDMSPTSACYYDASMVAIEAIKQAEIKGIKHIRQDRRKIRNALESFYDEKNGIKGVTGSIYFDENRSTRRAYAVAVYQHQKMIPAFFQYRQFFIDIQGELLLKKIMEGEIIFIDNILMKSIHLIFTGINRIQLNHVDLKAKTVDLDFDIWFKYQGDFDINQIEFRNQQSLLQIEPVQTETIDGVTTSVFHVRGLFEADVDFRLYPFKSQSIQVCFQHRFYPMNELIFVSSHQSTQISSDNKWKIQQTKFFSDVIVKQSSLGIPKYFQSKLSIDFSKFVTEIHFRKTFEYTMFILIFLAIGVFFVLYRLLTMPPHHILRAVKKIITLFILNSMCYLKWMSDFSTSYITISDVVFLSVYVLLTGGVVVFFIRFKQQQIKA